MMSFGDLFRPNVADDHVGIAPAVFLIEDRRVENHEVVGYAKFYYIFSQL